MNALEVLMPGDVRRTRPQRTARASGARAYLACCLVLGGALLAFVRPSHAEQADRNKPLVYSADHLSYDDLKQTTILTGNVEMTKGTIILRGDRAEIHQDPEGYSYATATVDKGLAYIREKRDGVDEYFEGQSKRIDYNGKTDVSILTGQAVARRLSGTTTPIDEVHGSVIRYDGQTGFYTAQSNGGTQTGTPGGRVRGMIAPTTNTPTGAVVTPSTDGTATAPAATMTPATPAIPSSASPGAQTRQGLDGSATAAPDSTTTGASDPADASGATATTADTADTAVTTGNATPSATQKASGAAGAAPLEPAQQLKDAQ